MFCIKCGEKLQPEADFCGNCGSAASSLSRAAPPASEPESDEKPTWLKVLFVLWAFAYSFVGVLLLYMFVVEPILLYLDERNLGVGAIRWWLLSNVYVVPTVVGLGNALTRGVAAARRM